MAKILNTLDKIFDTRTISVICLILILLYILKFAKNVVFLLLILFIIIVIKNKVIDGDKKSIFTEIKEQYSDIINVFVDLYNKIKNIF